MIGLKTHKTQMKPTKSGFRTPDRYK